MAYTPKKFNYYQFVPDSFWQRWQISEVDGIHLGILRLIHDRMWQTDTQPRALEVSKFLHKQLRISKEQLEQTLGILEECELITFDIRGDKKFIRAKEMDDAIVMEAEFRGKKKLAAISEKQPENDSVEQPF